MGFITKLNNVNLVDKIENTSETYQGILVKKLDKIAKRKGFLSGPSYSPLALDSLL